MRGITSDSGSRRRPWIVGLLATALLIAGAVPVLAARVPTDPEPDIACHADHGTGMLTRYATTVETPADSDDWYVSVEFTLEGEGASCELVLATYELPSNEFTLPQTLYDSDGGTFGAGTHTLTAALPREGELPGCWSQYDFAFGPAIETLTGADKYGDRQVRARIVGTESCAIQQPTPSPSESEQAATPTPSPTPSPTPRDGELGGTPTPTPGGGELPDTSVPHEPSSALSWALSLLLLASVSLVATRRALVARQRR